jgi:hypothetical protein
VRQTRICLLGVCLLAVVVTLAGCFALPGGSSDGTDSEDTLDGPLPPGVDESGDVTETVLLNETLRAANTTTVRLAHRNGDRRSTFYNGIEHSYAQTDDGVTWIAGGNPWTDDASGGRLVVTNDTVLDGEYSVEYQQNTSFGTLQGAVPVTGLSIRLGTSAYEYDSRLTRNGTTLHRLTLSGTRNAGRAVGHYTGQLLVDSEGRIHRLWGEIGDNESVADPYEYDFDWSVEDVPEPSWLGQVPRAAASLTQNGTVFAVTVTGGPPIPAGTELEFTHSQTRSTVTLNESLAPGETLSLAVRAGPDQAAVVSRDTPAGEFVSLRGERTQLQGTATLDGTRVSLLFAIGHIL